MSDPFISCRVLHRILETRKQMSWSCVWEDCFLVLVMFPGLICSAEWPIRNLVLLSASDRIPMSKLVHNGWWKGPTMCDSWVPPMACDGWQSAWCFRALHQDMILQLTDPFFLWVSLSVLSKFCVCAALHDGSDSMWVDSIWRWGLQVFPLWMQELWRSLALSEWANSKL